MEPSTLFGRIAAVVSSLLLVGVFVWHQSGRSLLVGSTTAAEANQENVTPPGASSTQRPAIQSNDIPSTSSPTASTSIWGTTSTLLPGSKAWIHAPPTSTPTQHQRLTLQPGATETSGSTFFGEFPSPSNAPSRENSNTRPTQTLMPGSKSEAVVPARRATDGWWNRVFIPSTKAARVIRPPLVTTSNSSTSSATSNSLGMQPPPPTGEVPSRAGP